MQTCPDCGARNEDGELFCGACGTYLEWEESQRSSSSTAELTESEQVSESGVEQVPATAELAGAGNGPGEGVEQAGRSGVEQVSETGFEQVPATADLAGAGNGPGEGVEKAGEGVEDGLAASARRAAVRDEAAPTEASAPAEVSSAVDGSPPATTSLGESAVVPSADTPNERGQEPGPDVAEQEPDAAKPASPRRERRGWRRARQAATRAALGAAPPAVTRAAGAASLAKAGLPTRRSAPEADRAAADVPEDTVARTAAPDAAAPATTKPTAAKPAAVKPAPATKPAAVKPRAASPAPVKPAAVPAPVKPAAAKPRRYVPPSSTDDPPPAPGDLICGACGAGNAPHRNFCRRCGASLADAPTQGRDGWWRRWRARRKARKEGPRAGTRPKRRRRRRFPVKTVVLLVILGLLAGAGWHYRDDLRTGYNTVLDRVSGDKPINPAEVTASSSASDRGPELARDGISDRSWAPEVTGDGAGEWLQFDFAQPFRLVTVLLTSGASTEDETRLEEARPSRVRFTVTTEDGQEHITDMDIVDTGTPQALHLPYSDVASVRMTILAAYGAAEDHHVAVAEVEFRGR